MFVKQLKPLWLTAIVATTALALSSCASGGGGDDSKPDPDVPAPVEGFGISDDDYTLEALIAAAQTEGEITVTDSTGKIVDQAEAFGAKYGIKINGIKMKATEQIETAIRENQAGNIQTDVLVISDVPTVASELLDREFVVSWIPPDLKDDIDPKYHHPLTITVDPNVWAYNTEVYGDTCPVDNMWDLTTDNHAGKLVFQDVALKPTFYDWFNQMAKDSDDEMRQAYKDFFGEELETDEPSATHEWVKRFEQNNVRLTNGSQDMADAVGAPGQSDPFFGMVAVSKFRENDSNGYVLGVCKEMKPWIGPAYGKTAVISAGTKNPNASKLFVHYLLTEEGIALQLDDGKISTNNTISMPEDEPTDVMSYFDDMFIVDSKFGARDFDDRTEWNDFWIMNKK